MFYVSDIRGDNIGITDTSDSVTEFYLNKQIVGFVEKQKIDIYGVSVFNHHADCNVLQVNQKLSVSRLKELLADWKKVHNKWTGHKVEDYLASAKVGTKIIAEYIYTGDGDRRQHRGATVIERLNSDVWSYKDSNNTMSGKTGDSRFAAWCLEVAYICGRPVSISII